MLTPICHLVFKKGLIVFKKKTFRPFLKTFIIMHSFSAVFCVSIFCLIHNLEIYGFFGRCLCHFSACFSFRFSFFQKSFPFENFSAKMENRFLRQAAFSSSSPALMNFHAVRLHNDCIIAGYAACPHRMTQISRPRTKKTPRYPRGVRKVRVSRKYSGDLWQARTADLLVVTQVLSQLS